MFNRIAAHFRFSRKRLKNLSNLSIPVIQKPFKIISFACLIVVRSSALFISDLLLKKTLMSCTDIYEICVTFVHVQVWSYLDRLVHPWNLKNKYFDAEYLILGIWWMERDGLIHYMNGYIWQENVALESIVSGLFAPGLFKICLKHKILSCLFLNF